MFVKRASGLELELATFDLTGRNIAKFPQIVHLSLLLELLVKFQLHEAGLGLPLRERGHL